MTMNKDKNKTRYNTEDLQKLLLDLYDLRIDGRAILRAGKITSVEYFRPASMEKRTSRRRYRGRGRDYPSRYASVGDTVLKIASPSCLAKVPSCQMELLTGVLPREILFEAVTQIISASMPYSTTSKAIDRLANEVVDNHSVQVMERVERGAASRFKLTPQQRIDRLQSPSFYGMGGQLLGAPGGTRNGVRSSSARWKWRIAGAKRYYDRELASRMQHKPALEQCGVQVKPYESFAEYLRRLADLIDQNQPIY
jgi:hypothetical protein